jgi:hypothetical protein
VSPSLVWSSPVYRRPRPDGAQARRRGDAARIVGAARDIHPCPASTREPPQPRGGPEQQRPPNTRAGLLPISKQPFRDTVPMGEVRQGDGVRRSRPVARVRRRVRRGGHARQRFLLHDLEWMPQVYKSRLARVLPAVRQRYRLQNGGNVQRDVR